MGNDYVNVVCESLLKDVPLISFAWLLNSQYESSFLFMVKQCFY